MYYEFKNSFYGEIWRNHPGKKINPHFQQIEFFGDKIISYEITRILMKKKRSAKEMSISIAENCSTAIMAKIFKPFRKYLKFSGELTDNMLADSLEVFIGCIHLDGGAKAARKMIQNLWHKELGIKKQANAKNRLQEHPKVINRNVRYKYKNLIDHNKKPYFLSTVTINNNLSCQGRGISKKTASIDSANNMLKLLK